MGRGAVAGPGEVWRFPNTATPRGSVAYYSLRFARPGERDGLAALVGWRHQVRVILDQVADPSVAAAKLDWWRQELGRAARGVATHPLSQRLGPLMAARALPLGPFLELTQGTESVLSQRWPPDLPALVGAAGSDLGALFELLLLALGDQDPGRLGRARRLGAYASLVGQLRDSGGLARRGRWGFVPADRLAALGLRPQDLGRPAGRRELAGLLEGLAVEARRVRAGAEDGAEDLAGLPVSVRIWVRLSDRLLAELAAVGFDLADQRLALTPLAKLWYAWRESRRPPALGN